MSNWKEGILRFGEHLSGCQVASALVRPAVMLHKSVAKCSLQALSTVLPTA